MFWKEYLKRFRFTPLYLSVLLVLCSYDMKGSIISEPNPDKSYVVIGAFAYEKNAIKLMNYAQQNDLVAHYEKRTDRDLYYVYVFSSDDKEEAVSEANRIRNMYDFNDVWVFTGSFNEQPETMLPSEDIAEEKPVSVIAEEEDDTEAKPMSVPEEQITDFGTDIKGKEAKSINLVPEEGYYYLYLNSVNIKNYQEVKGKVRIIDSERLKELDKVKTHELVKLRDPNNGTERIQLITDIFGFKEVQHNLYLDNPINDSTETFVETQGDSIIVNFDMQRFKKGDVLVMYNVYFFKDAAIMKPESIFELNSLLDMLNENKKFKVTIHGHTNGNSMGKIIHLDEENKNYFSLDHEHKETKGSAKKLSFYRASTIQQWLIEQGVDPERMEVKGWGGKKMLYDKFDAQAYKNVRVEIEITDD
ncbi:OmpA family protein [Fulvivirga maritima]|uniref:OmpA family protein n=1 Tax=Fulvivirga maritima TaxID=2904247 RepID=UPI001F44CBD8|nr:OmpA family protein [Fulvivirga maritima]UII27323.1 OmpA family protein [Fulvivirga maritima]